MKNPHKGKKDKNLVYSVILYRKEDIINYINKIGFKNPKHNTKWLIYKKLGYCPPNTKLKQRLDIIQSSKNL